jgi:transcriptional/translational regulatory protein YebC/TACO1
LSLDLSAGIVMGRGPSIEGRKSAEDAKRAKVFTKLIREITVATRAGVADPASIRACARRGQGAVGQYDQATPSSARSSVVPVPMVAPKMQELRYEGYGPAGIALIIDCVTDNPVRTVADVRHALTKHGGNLGTSGSVAFQFTRCGELVFETHGEAAWKRKFWKPRSKPVPTMW